MTPAPQVDLHTLANLPGAGRAAEALVMAGYRLPANVPEAYQLFRVEVIVRRNAFMIVAAEDESAARITAAEAAERMASLDDVETDCRRVTLSEALQMIRTERLPFEVDA